MRHNYKLTIEYDGTHFLGWQIQPVGRTVQGDLENALKQLHPDQKITLIGSGRTDSGVHARNQVAHIKLDTRLSDNDLKNAVNARLDKDVRIKAASKVSDSFHARYNPLWRQYSYFIRKSYSPLARFTTWWVRYPLIQEQLHVCANQVLGEHDFTSFCKADAEVEHKRCFVEESHWSISADNLTYSIRANRFLQHMVRYLVGTMVEVARGRYSEQDFSDLIHNTENNLSVVRAPAQGLILEEIKYPESGFSVQDTTTDSYEAAADK